MFCTKCGNQTNPNDAFCGECGAPRVATPFSSLGEAQASDQNDKKDLYAAIIGPKNTDYYLNYFAKADAAGRAGASWNWPAFFVTFYWLLYRKLWVPAVVYFFAPFVTTVIAARLAMALGLGEDAATVVSALTYLATGYVLPAMYANRFYYNRCNELVTQTQRIHSAREDQLQWLAREGSTSRVGMWLAVIVIGTATLGILAAIAIPAYQDYTTRAQVSEGLNLAGPAKAAVTESYTNTGVWPKDNASAGLPEQVSGKYVESVHVVGSGLIITFKDAPPVSSPLRGKDLYMVAGLASNGAVVWQCGSHAMDPSIQTGQFDFEQSGGGGSVAQKHRPAECRG